MSYQTSSKRSPPFSLLIGVRKTQVFWHQSEARTAVTVKKWSGKTLSPGALLAVLYFSFVPYFLAGRQQMVLTGNLAKKQIGQFEAQHEISLWPFERFLCLRSILLLFEISWTLRQPEYSLFLEYDWWLLIVCSQLF